MSLPGRAQALVLGGLRVGRSGRCLPLFGFRPLPRYPASEQAVARHRQAWITGCTWRLPACPLAWRGVAGAEIGASGGGVDGISVAGVLGHAVVRGHCRDGAGGAGGRSRGGRPPGLVGGLRVAPPRQGRVAGECGPAPGIDLAVNRSSAKNCRDVRTGSPLRARQSLTARTWNWNALPRKRLQATEIRSPPPPLGALARISD